MAQWGDGYITDLTYTSGFFRETTPGWLAMVALLRGYRTPDLTRPFRYVDLGCGNGFTAIVVAATLPQAEVWGFDFNPAHIEAASRLAAAADLPNVQFREASFAELAAQPDSALPGFDFVVCHGVLTHVSANNRGLLFGLIGRWLKPGGLAYLGYNVAVGWAAMAPVRALMRMLAAAPSGRAGELHGLPDPIVRLRAAGARFFRDNPALEARLDAMQRQDPRYLAHEYLGADWHPLMFADVADAMAGVKCGFIGSATLVENRDAMSVPPGCLALLEACADVRQQETLRDFARAGIPTRRSARFRADRSHRAGKDVTGRRGTASSGATEQACPRDSRPGRPPEPHVDPGGGTGRGREPTGHLGPGRGVAHRRGRDAAGRAVTGRRNGRSRTARQPPAGPTRHARARPCGDPTGGAPRGATAGPPQRGPVRARSARAPAAPTRHAGCLTSRHAGPRIPTHAPRRRASSALGVKNPDGGIRLADSGELRPTRERQPRG